MQALQTYKVPEEDAGLLERVTAFTQRIRHSQDLFGFENSTVQYPSPESGTTFYTKCDDNGVYPYPVYYDWAANWDSVVKELVQTPSVQHALRVSVNDFDFSKADSEDPNPYDERFAWPWFYCISQNSDTDEHCMMNQLLHPEYIGEMNQVMADHLQHVGEILVKNYYGSNASEQYQLAPEDLERDLRHAMDSTAVALDLWKRCRAKLYDLEKGVFREKLLVCGDGGESHKFLPFNYQLAKMISPSNATLRLYVSDAYALVYDETHKIVYDTVWYFAKRTARRTLEEAQLLPQKEGASFDFTLGGIVETSSD